MPQPPDWKRVLETGMHFTELRRSHARQLASDLVSQGQLARDQLGAAVDELVDISRRRSDELRTVVTTEVQRQLGVIGFATKRDLEALERRMTTKTSPRKAAGSSSSKRAPAKKKTGPAKKSARSTPAKKVGATKSTARKSAAKPAKKTPAKKSTAKKTVRASSARRASVKRTGTKTAAGKPAAKRAR